ncbi:substrate binding domain-containing protein [Thalassospira lohafexi]|uniref:substrate binding domain-containing protein n=1 Tax=Thalassospira lohafexi TaxID=744227 RepID=UPI001F0C6024|nr:substrate binding domain-containing protein [Thalassospira lohafexi]
MGKISLSCSVHMGNLRIVPILSRFRQTYPGVALDVRLTDEVVDLIGQGIDIAIRSGPLRSSELKSIRLYETRRVIVASQQYVAAFGIPDQPEDLTDHNWVMYSRVPETLRLAQGDQERKVPVSGSVQVDSATARLQFLRDGHGMAVVPFSDVADDISNGDLMRILPDWNLPDLSVYAVYSGDVMRSSKVKTLLDFLRAQLADIDESRH